MALLGPNTDYTDKDFDALLARCRNLIPAVFPEWTDQDVADFGNIIVELFCFVGDVLTKYQDNQAAEAFIGRVTQRRNILALCKLINFVPRGSTASQVDLVVTCSPVPVGTVSIPARSRARTEAVTNPTVFETLAAFVIPAGIAGPFTISAENAQQKQELYSASGKPNFEMRLGASPFLDDSLSIIAGNGVYDVVDDFLDSTSLDRHCTVSVDQNDRATVRFGNGINGVVPAGTITATYKVGGGTAGRVEASAIRRFEGTFTDSFGNPVTLQVTNTLPSSAALDRQSVEEIRATAPRSVRVLTRTVAREDFEINALRVPGVSRALMLTSDQDGAIAENAGALFVVPTGGGLPTQAVKDAVLEMVTVTYPCTLTFDVTVYDPSYLVVDIATVVYLKQGASSATTRAAILANLAAAFAIDPASDGTDTSIDGVDFGYNLRDADGNQDGSLAWSDVFNVIRDSAGVRKLASGSSALVMNGVDGDLPIEPRQFPVLGTVTIINGDTASPL